ncbi:hypothetical protein D9M72_601780 [compost metagenome]
MAVRILEEGQEGLAVDPGDRNIGADPVDQQRAEREQQAFVQLGRLGERAYVHIGSKLFSGRSHQAVPQTVTIFMPVVR